MDLVRIILVVVVAAVAYYILTPLAGLPSIVGILAAVLVLLAGLAPALRGRV